MFNSRTFRSIIILIVALVFASTAYAMAASNTLADGGKAGDGNGAVSGYTVSGIKYNLDTTDPSLIASVEFDLSPTGATSAAASLTNTSTSTETFATSCGHVADHWTCAFPVIGVGTVTALNADSLRVIAAQ
jgi:hypothetical protein